MVSPAVTAITQALLTSYAREGGSVSLEAIADAIGASAVTLSDIEAIFDALEQAGRCITADQKDPPAALKRVLATVRSFSAVSGRRPTVPEIAEHSGLAASEVRFAMLYARVLAR